MLTYNIYIYFAGLPLSSANSIHLRKLKPLKAIFNKGIKMLKVDNIKYIHYIIYSTLVLSRLLLDKLYNII